MRKIADRNYKTKPHTARFLMAFHTAAYGLPAELADENAAEYALAAGDGAVDLLDTVDVDAVVDARSEAQTRFMESLIGEVTALDAELGQQARTYTDGMTEHGKWTPGREGNASRWITNLIAKRDELKARAPQAPAAPVQVEDGRYAVEENGALRFFKVKNGRRPGFVFLDIQASDEWHSIRNLGRIQAVLALIAQDPHAAMVRYGHELGVCGRCGRTLTDEASRAAGIGPICADK